MDRHYPLIAIALLALLVACADETTDATSPTPSGNGETNNNAANNANNTGIRCNVAALADQCPVGSLPSFEGASSDTCTHGDEIIDADGAVSGVCFVRESCTFVCNFQDPCACGIASITTEAIVCMPCTTACGNALCETGEDPAACPLDCAASCQDGDFRCNGSHRELCQDNGQWDLLTCRDAQRCAVTTVGTGTRRGVAVCEPVRWELGGTFEGTGSIPGVDASVEYGRVRLPIGQLPPGSVPLAFVDRDTLLIEGPALVDLSDPNNPAVITTYPDAQDGAVFSPTYWAKGLDVGEMETRALQVMSDPGGVFGDASGGYIHGRVGLDATATFSFDGARYALPFAYGLTEETSSSSIFVWDSATGELEAQLAYDDLTHIDATRPALSLAFSPNTDVLGAYYPSAGFLILWDLTTSRIISRVELGLSAGDVMAFDPGGNNLLAFAGRRPGGGDFVHVWDFTDPEAPRHALDLQLSNMNVSHTEPIRSISLSPNGRWLAIGHDAHAELVEVETGAITVEYSGGGRTLIDPYGERIVVGELVMGPL